MWLHMASSLDMELETLYAHCLSSQTPQQQAWVGSEITLSPWRLERFLILLKAAHAFSGAAVNRFYVFFFLSPLLRMLNPTKASRNQSLMVLFKGLQCSQINSWKWLQDCGKTAGYFPAELAVTSLVTGWKKAGNLLQKTAMLPMIQQPAILLPRRPRCPAAFGRSEQTEVRTQGCERFCC